MLDNIVGNLSTNGIKAVQPVRDAGMAPERPTAVKVPCVIRVTFIGTHAIILSELADDWEELSEFLHFIYCLESRFAQLLNVEPTVVQLKESTHTVPAQVFC